MTRLPVTTIGGYLGAGKTTLVNALLSGDHGLRIGILVNDFGAISIDRKLIVAREGDVVTLANGCACCTIAGDLATALDFFAGRTSRFDQVVVEASGVADPSRIAALARSPGLQRGATVVVADAETVLARATDKFVGRLVHRQLASADVIVLNKIDLVDAQKLSAACAFAADVAPRARVLAASQGRVPPTELLGAAALTPAHSLVCAPGPPALASEMFESHLWASDEPADIEALRAAVAGLPPAIVRIKGIVATGQSRALALQRAGERLTVDRIDGAARATGAEFVVIGRVGTLDRLQIDSVFDACLISHRTRQ